MGNRLSHDERREQLVLAGLELLGRRPYDEVSIGDIAEAAGISKGLLYHYFPTKTDFVVAVLAASREELAELIDTDTPLDPAARLDAGLDAFLGYAESHAPGYLAVARARGGGNATIRQVLERARRGRVRTLARLAAAIADVPAGELGSPLLDAALEGWLHSTDVVVSRWLTGGDMTRREVHLVLRVSFLGALEAAGMAGATPALARLRDAAARVREADPELASGASL